MSMTNTEAGKSFLAGVLSKLPEHLRAQAEAAFTDAQAQAALDELGAGTKRQDEFSREMDKARADIAKANELYAKNTAWWDLHKNEVEENKRLRAQLEADGGEPDPKPAADGGKKYVTQEELGAVAADALGLFGATPVLAIRHYQTFGQVLDMGAVIRKAQTDHVTVEKAYDVMFATELKAKAEEAEAVRVRKIEEAAVDRYRRENPSMPYPSPRAQTGSPLDGLMAKKPETPVDLVAEATAMYDSLVAQKTGAGV